MGWASQLPSGRWRGNYRDRTGRIRSAGTHPHKRAAEKAAIVAEDESRRLGWRDPAAAGRTWEEWCAEWWPTRGVEQSTLVRDASRRDVHLAPRWSAIPLVDITRHDVKAWAADLGREGLSAATVQRCVSLLSASLAAAVDAEILDTNAAARLRLTAGQQSHERYLTEDEQAALLEQLEPGSLGHSMVTLLLGTGMRWGEACGLQVKRLSLGTAMVRVAETWDSRNRVAKAYPKGRVIRDVPLPDWVVDALEPHVLGRRTGFVLTSDGSPLDYNNWRSRVWEPAVQRAGLSPLRIHDLRHTYASTLIQRGIPLAEVQRLLGHKSAATTQRYAHLAPVEKSPIVEALRRPSRGALGEQTSTTPDSNVLQFRPRQSG